MARKLPDYERETIINFNEAEDTATIFTYNKSWQKHLEEKLGLKLTMDNGYGGKEYQISKKRIKPPRAARRLSAKAKKGIVKRLGNGRRQKAALGSKSNAETRKREKNA